MVPQLRTSHAIKIEQSNAGTSPPTAQVLCIQSRLNQIDQRGLG